MKRLGLCLAVASMSCAALGFSDVLRHPAVAASSTNWTTYANGNSRTGYDSIDPNFAQGTIRHLWDSPTLDGRIYAQPLVYGSETVVVTENDSVYALRTSDGSQIWHVNLGSPVSNSSLPCGNVNPVGVTSTPVLDPTTGMLYVLALLNNPIRYVLFGIDSSNGALWFQDIIPPVSAGFDPTTQNQRGALGLSNGNVVMSFGGRYGDCGTYTGWVMTFPESGNVNGPLGYWSINPGIASVGGSPHNGAGIWAPNGETIDAAGNIYVATGNSTNAGSSYDGSESVLKLSPTLSLLDYWYPSNWQSLSTSDTDMGPAPMFINSSTMFVTGKAGDGYLLNANSLGHNNGQLATAHVCPGLYADAVFGGTAYDGSKIYVPCDNGLVALNVNTSSPSMSVAWQASETNAGPPTVADGLIWDEDYGANKLYAYDQSGNVQFSWNLSGNTHFGSPAAAGGQIFVPAGNYIASFNGNSTPITNSPCNYYNVTSNAYAGSSNPLQHPDGTMINLSGNLYWIQYWTLCPIGSMSVLASYNPNSFDIKTGTSADNTLALGASVYFRNGTLLKGQSSPNVYVVHQTGAASWELRLITSIDFFTGLGYTQGDIISVPDSNLSAPQGPAIGSTAQHPDGTVVRDATSGNIFLLNNGQKDYIGSMPAYTSWRLSSQQTKTATAADLALGNGPNLDYRDGSLVKGSGPNVYVVHLTPTGNQKRLISSGQTFASLGYSSQDIITVPDQELPAANGPAI